MADKNQNTSSVQLDKELISQLKKRINSGSHDPKQTYIPVDQVIDAVISLLLDLDYTTVNEIDEFCTGLRKADLSKAEANRQKGFTYIADTYKEKAHQERLLVNMLHMLCRQKDEFRMEDDIQL